MVPAVASPSRRRRGAAASRAVPDRFVDASKSTPSAQAKLNGKDFLQQKVQYPVFTEPDTSSIGIDELQCLLLKNALLLGVDFRLGAAYKNATPEIDPETCMPTWNVDVVYDEEAAAQFGVPAGKNVEPYDALIGCDGPRSTVRDTMTKYLGDIEKRKFMDCVGIVANVRKVSRKRLKEMGFEYGQEPNDMNRTKMIFKDFFAKINEGPRRPGGHSSRRLRDAFSL